MLASVKLLRQLVALRDYKESCSKCSLLGFIPVQPSDCSGTKDGHGFSLELIDGGAHDLALLSALGSCLARAAAPLDFAEKHDPRTRRVGLSTEPVTGKLC